MTTRNKRSAASNFAGLDVPNTKAQRVDLETVDTEHVMAFLPEALIDIEVVVQMSVFHSVRVKCHKYRLFTESEWMAVAIKGMDKNQTELVLKSHPWTHQTDAELFFTSLCDPASDTVEWKFHDIGNKQFMTHMEALDYYGCIKKLKKRRDELAFVLVYPNDSKPYIENMTRLQRAALAHRFELHSLIANDASDAFDKGEFDIDPSLIKEYAPLWAGFAQSQRSHALTLKRVRSVMKEFLDSNMAADTSCKHATDDAVCTQAHCMEDGHTLDLDDASKLEDNNFSAYPFEALMDIQRELIKGH